MPTLFLLRHGETTWNKNGRVMGRLEVPLNRRGIVQAKHIAKILSRVKIDAVYASPLKRALQTAKIVTRSIKAPLNIEPQLTEVGFGRWEGRNFDQLARDKTYNRFIESPMTAKLPGGETMRGVQRRGLEALRRAIRKHPQGRLLFVTHGDVIRAILCHYLRLSLGEFRHLRIDNGSLTAVDLNGPWAECTFINYVPDITRLGHQRYTGPDPTQRK
ncbi:MAG: histidine phosphatase family protein [Deltaproteobacteria bacterium]|nr:histidine phosphatase family protein [Deltaproteobacteria bacterium]